MIERPKVSVIVPFISLNGYVLDCIEHCLFLDYPDYDLILLPDEKIELPSVLMANPKLKTIETGIVSIAEKRNRGIASSIDAWYYAFIDSDAYPHKEWLTNGIDSFSKSNDIWGVGGPSICPPNENFRRRIVSRVIKSIFVSGIDAKAFRENIIKGRFCIDLPTCNLIIKREVIDRLGFFNKEYTTGEDKEFCSRIIKANKKIFFAINVIVCHHSRPIFLSFIKQRVIYGLSVLKIARRNWSLFNLCLFFPTLFILFIIVLFIFSFFNQYVSSVLLITILLYVLIILLETLRWSSNLLEIPYTFLALIIGNLMPSIGTLMAMLNVKVDIREVYRNYE